MDDTAYFGILDYIVFGGMLGISALIGIYFAFFAKQKQNTTAEYLMGGRTIGMFPMSMSLIASSISGISLLGYPSEMYTFGSQLYVALWAEVLSYTATIFLFLPVLYNLRLTSSYEYLERRYSPKIRKMGSALFLAGTMLYIPIVIYVPALAFAQVTGMSLQILIPLVCIVCIFYTTVGGLKAVVWTDTLQTCLILVGVATVSIVGTVSVGGVGAVWQRNLDAGRIDFFNMSWDPTIRHSFWTVFIGKFFHNLCHCTANQSIVQRYLATPSLRAAKMIVVFLIFGMIVLVSFCCYTGLVIFAAFYNCDPVTVRHVAKHDQLLPYFVMKFTGNIPGLPGIFVAGVFSAALSTMSTCLNSMTGVLFEDFIRPTFKKPVSEAKASYIMKLIVVVIGAVTVVLASVVDKLGGIIQTSSSLNGITAGTLLGLFFLGMLFPWTNSKGVFWGGIAGSFFVAWVSFGTQFAIAQKKITFPRKPVSIEGCDNSTLTRYFTSLANVTLAPLEEAPDEPFFLYKLSYVYYPLLGLIICIAVAMVVSYFTGMNKPHKMDPDLLSPVVHKFINFVDEDVVNEKLMKNHKNSVDLKNVKLENGNYMLQK